MMDFSRQFLVASSVISTIGLGYFMYGKKSGKTSSLISGIGMMIFPYFIHNVGYMILITAILCVIPLFG